LSTAGDTHLGGEDFDQIIVDDLVERFAKKHSIDLKSNPRALMRLKIEVEKAKRDFSSVNSVKINIESIMNDIDFGESYSRARFEQLCQKHFEKTLDPIK
jgi:heat shock protein 5